VCSLIEDGAEPQQIIAFTFTERAAASLQPMPETDKGIEARHNPPATTSSPSPPRQEAVFTALLCA
jgi:hypothetical protein